MKDEDAPRAQSRRLIASSFRVPRQGRYWLLAVASLITIGWLKGINLILLLSYLMLMLWGVNFVLAGRRLRRLEARRRIEGSVFAQTPFAVHVSVFNPLPQALFGFWIEDRGPQHEATWFLMQLRGRETVRFEQQLLLRQRGRYAWQPLRAGSGYPFGLAQRTVRLTPATDLIVLPRLGRLHRGRLKRFLTCTAPLAERLQRASRALPTAQAEFHGLRPFRGGDSPRSIHWRTSARRGELMVREYENGTTDNLVLVFDPWLPTQALPGLFAPLEEALSLAATICWEWCRQKGDRFVLAVAGSISVVLEGVTSREHALRMLECLAVVPGETAFGAAPLLEQLSGTTLPTGPVLVVSTRGGELADAVRTALHRPVAWLHALQLDSVDFYEKPA